MEMEWDYDEMMASNPQFKQSEIDELQIWVGRLEFSSNIPKQISNSLLLCFHNACNFIMEDTKKCIQAYYSARESLPELFNQRDMSQDDLREIADVIGMTVFPEKTDDGCVIVSATLRNSDASRFNFHVYSKYLLMTVDRIIIEHGPVNGLILLFCVSGMQFGHVTKVNLTTASKVAAYFQEAIPVKLRKYHMLDVSSVYEKLSLIMNPFLKKSVLEMIHLHPLTDNFDLFHKNHIPKKCLPPIYGGTLPDLSMMQEENVQKLIKLKPYFDEEEKDRLKYSSKEITGLFRSLDID